MIVTVDGPAGVGKGTLAKRLAATFDFAYMDTGLLYRAVGATLVERGADPGDAAAAVNAARLLRLEDIQESSVLRSEDIGQVASVVATIPEVRGALLAFQRAFANNPPNDATGAILDGRDTGTVVCPHADLKIFLTANISTRARRRLEQLHKAGKNNTYAAVFKHVESRDLRDSKRALAPLKPSSDALVINTTDLGKNAVFEFARARIAAKQ